MAIERFSASRVDKLIACPASANLEESIPGWVGPTEEENNKRPAISKGHEFHALLEQVGGYSAWDQRKLAEAILYVAEIRSRRRFKVLTEDKQNSTWLQTNPETTVDLVLYRQDELHIIDWKTGSIPVSVDDNGQLKFYALNYVHLAPKAKGAYLHIVQPWADNMAETFVTTTELAQFAHQAKTAEAKILAGDKTFGPSDHCKFCPANPHARGLKGSPKCPAMMQLLYPMTVAEDDILALD